MTGALLYLLDGVVHELSRQELLHDVVHDAIVVL